MRTKEVCEIINNRLFEEFKKIKADKYISPSKVNQYVKYLKPRPKKDPKNGFYIFLEKHVEIIYISWCHILNDIKTRKAFEKAYNEINNPQKKLF